MRIVRRTSTELTLHSPGTTLIQMGAAVAAMGLLAAWFATHAHKPLVGLLAVLVFGGAGVVCILSARELTHCIDTHRGTVTITTRPVLHTSRTRTEQIVYKLADISGVELDARETSEADGGNRSMVYRLVYVFRDGKRVPWASYWTSGYAGYEAIRTTVSAFLAERASDARWPAAG